MIVTTTPHPLTGGKLPATLGHEFSGTVEEVGSDVTGFKVGDRVVASFQIACGDCYYCNKKLSSQCEKTCSNETARGIYGEQTAGIFGYSYFTGGFAGGQAEYVRVPFGGTFYTPPTLTTPYDRSN